MLLMNDISSFLWRTRELLAQRSRTSQHDLLTLLRAGMKHQEAAKELIHALQMDKYEEKRQSPENMLVLGLDPRLCLTQQPQNQKQRSDAVGCETDMDNELMRRVAGPNAVETCMDTIRASMRAYVRATHIQLLVALL